MNILAILYGGKSGEHEVSLRSAASVIRHAPWTDAQIILIGISPDGYWYLQDRDLVTKVRSGLDLTVTVGPEVLGLPSRGLFVVRDGTPRKLELDIVFPLVHGTFGEDGTMQGYLEILDLPYVGSGVLGSSLGMDKEKVKHIWQDAGIPVVPFKVFRKSQYHEEEARIWYQELSRTFGSELFVKPSRGGSSVGISKASDLQGFLSALDLAFRFDTKVLVEPAVDAREIELSVMGNDQVTSFVPGEIIPKHHQFYDYEAKYLDPDGAAIVIPAPLSAAETAQVKTLAERAYTSCEARGLSRVDFFLDRKTGSFMINEINTLPGFTSISMFPMMCEAGGLPYGELIAKLCDLGMKEFNEKQQLRFSKM